MGCISVVAGLRINQMRYRNRTVTYTGASPSKVCRALRLHRGERGIVIGLLADLGDQFGVGDLALGVDHDDGAANRPAIGPSTILMP